MNEEVELVILYDYYSKLLTPRQCEYFESYYFDNLSLSEISENYGVSKNAVHKTLKTIKEELNKYEAKLELYKKSKSIKKIISQIDDEKIKKSLQDLV